MRLLRVFAVFSFVTCVYSLRHIRSASPINEDHDMTDHCHNISQFSKEHYCEVFAACCNKDTQKSATVCESEQETCILDPSTGNVTEKQCILKNCFVPVKLVTVSDGSQAKTPDATVKNDNSNPATTVVPLSPKPDGTSPTAEQTTVQSPAEKHTEKAAESVEATEKPKENGEGSDPTTKASGEVPPTGPATQSPPAARPAEEVKEGEASAEGSASTESPDGGSSSGITTQLIILLTTATLLLH